MPLRPVLKTSMYDGAAFDIRQKTKEEGREKKKCLIKSVVESKVGSLEPKGKEKRSTSNAKANLYTHSHYTGGGRQQGN